MPKPLDLRGALTALVTPLTPDGTHVDWPAFDALVRRQLDAGVEGLVPCGTTGETPTLSSDEKLAVVRRTVELARGRVPVVAGAGSFSTQETAASARALAAAGADAVMVVMPYYSRPSQQALVEHVVAVARAADVAVVLYNHPGRTGVDLGADATVYICERAPNVVAIKDATGNVLRCQELVRRLGERLCVLSGDDALAVPMMSVGARGLISTTSNLLPERVVSVCRAALAGDWARARREHLALLPVYEAMFCEPSPAPVKFALSQRGDMSPSVRPPLLSLSPPGAERVLEVLRRAEATA